MLEKFVLKLEGGIQSSLTEEVLSDEGLGPARRRKSCERFRGGGTGEVIKGRKSSFECGRPFGRMSVKVSGRSETRGLLYSGS